MELTYIIISSVVIFGALLAYMILYSVRIVRLSNVEEGRIIFEYNPSTKMIHKYNFKQNMGSSRGFIKLPSSEVPVKSLITQFAGSKAEKIVRSQFHSINNGGSYSHERFTSGGVTKRTSDTDYNYDIRITRLSNKNKFTVSLSWKILNREVAREHQLIKSSIEKVVNNKKKYYGFVAFNFGQVYTDVVEKFVTLFETHSTKIGVSEYFHTNKLLIFYIADNNPTVIRKNLKKLMKATENASEHGLTSLYDGSCMLESKEIDTRKKLKNVIFFLDYFAYLSKKHGRQFVQHHSSLFSHEEFMEMTTQAKEFRAAIRSKEIKLKTVPVRRRKDNTKIIEYIQPSLPTVKDYFLKIFLQNPHDKNSLMNATAELVAFDDDAKKPKLIDINIDWLMGNIKNMKNKKVVYIINFHKYKYTTDVHDVIQRLKRRGFAFAIRVDEYTDEISSFVESIIPPFIIISKSLARNVYGKGNYMQLLSLKRLVEHKGIRSIFENPTEEKNSLIDQQVGLKYYYITN